jgi:DNA-directed RNA polymerase sigma subunit (sigma70/sigma32)
MATFLWRDDDGWPYRDPDDHAAIEIADRAVEVDEDLLSVQLGLASKSHALLSDLEPLERTVVTGHLGLDGATPRSLKALHQDLGLSRSEVRLAYESGLAKLRTRLRD